jgi:hypothetical protein
VQVDRSHQTSFDLWARVDGEINRMTLGAKIFNGLDDAYCPAVPLYDAGFGGEHRAVHL